MVTDIFAPCHSSNKLSSDYAVLVHFDFYQHSVPTPGSFLHLKAQNLCQSNQHRSQITIA